MGRNGFISRQRQIWVRANCWLEASNRRMASSALAALFHTEYRPSAFNIRAHRTEDFFMWQLCTILPTDLSRSVANSFRNTFLPPIKILQSALSILRAPLGSQPRWCNTILLHRHKSRGSILWPQFVAALGVCMLFGGDNLRRSQ
jgi:hypothetical protein